MDYLFIKDYPNDGNLIPKDTIVEDLDEQLSEKELKHLIKNGFIEEAKDAEEIIKIAVKTAKKDIKEDITEKRINIQVPKAAGSWAEGVDGRVEFLQAVQKAAYGRQDNRLETKDGPDGMFNSGSTGNTADGSFLVPIEYSDFVIQRIYEKSMLFPKTRTVPMTAKSIKIPATSDYSASYTQGTGAFSGVAGVTINQVGEGYAITPAIPQTAQITLNLSKYAAAAYATEELLEDSPYSVEALMSSWVADTFAQYLDINILQGDGTHGFKGLLSGGASGGIDPSVLTVNRKTSGAISFDDLLSMEAGMWPLGTENAVWVVSKSGYQALKNLTVGQFPVLLPNFSAIGEGPQSLFGRPLVRSMWSPAVGSTGDIMLCDFSQYLVGLHTSGIKSAVSLHVKFLQDERTYKWTLRCDGKSWLTNVFTADSATFSPFVALK